MITPYKDSTETKVEQVRKMFNRIAPEYDKLNRIISLGLDKSWRHKALRLLQPYAPKKLLDVATGTGDLAIDLLQQLPSAREVVGIDISEEMMRVAEDKVRALSLDRQISFKREDATATSFDAESFDAITIGFGIRNFTDIPAALKEFYRLLRPSGVLLIIELSEPKNKLLYAGYKLYAHGVIPLLGKLLTKDKDAYSYLPRSIAAMPQREAMVALMKEAGFPQAFYRSLSPGTCTLYLGLK